MGENTAHCTVKEAEALKAGTHLEGLGRAQEAPLTTPQDRLRAGGGAQWEGDLGSRSGWAPRQQCGPGPGTSFPGQHFLTGQGQSWISQAAPTPSQFISLFS